MTDPTRMSAVELLGLYKSRELSPVEATRAVLERIEGHNPRVNAFCLVDGEAALEAAQASEERYMAGEPTARKLDGVPTSIKDVFLTRGWPTLRGSKAISPDGPWEDDAPLVARLREHGAVLLGKTTTPELGWKGVTDGLLTGITRNPWDTAMTPGGSSGGSAAAVALGMGPLSVGTDGGGSVRIPAAFSGIFGLKPSYGRIPIWPPSPFGSLSHAGPMANTVADAALMLEALSEPDARDATALPYEKVAYSKEVAGGVSGLRIAFSPNLGYVDVDPEVAEAVERAARTFEEMGANVEEKDPGFGDPVECFNAHWFTAAASFVGHFEAGKRELIDPGLEEIVASGEKYSALEYLAAAEERADLGLRMSLFHETYDLLLTPAMPIPAFEAGRNVPEDFPHRQWMSWTPFSYPFNLTQQPAASVPCGFTESGLPIGLQIVGGRYEDVLVLRASHAYQTARPLDRRPPEE